MPGSSGSAPLSAAMIAGSARGKYVFAACCANRSVFLFVFVPVAPLFLAALSSRRKSVNTAPRLSLFHS